MQSLSHYFRNGVPGDTASLAVGRFNPFGKRFLTLAGIACYAASSDVLKRFDTSVVNDVLPRCHYRARAAPRHLFEHLDATVDTVLVSSSHRSFELLTNAPSIHSSRPLVRQPVNLE